MIEINNKDPMVLFKLTDYSTEIIGRFSIEDNNFYIEKGSGGKFKYGSFGILWVLCLKTNVLLQGPSLRHLNKTMLGIHQKYYL
jgi:hypothetical protein